MIPRLGLAAFSMLDELHQTSLEFNRASAMHAWAYMLEQTGLVEIKQLPQNECRVSITPSGRLATEQANHVLEAWWAGTAGQAGESTADLRGALTQAHGAVSKAIAQLDRLEAVMGLPEGHGR